MAKYALASGLKISPSLLNVVVAAEEQVTRAARPGDNGTGDVAWDKEQTDALARLAAAHAQLAHVVAPATPRTLLLIDRERSQSRLAFLGPVRLVRQLMLAGVILLVTFLVSALSSRVNNTSGDFFSSSGTTLLINQVFLLSAAGIGASFAALFRVNRYIANGTYDPKYESSYWVRFFLGLIAGVVLTALIPVQGGRAFTRPLLALLGGFSASVVYRILCRLVDTLESLVQGDSSDAVAAREQALKVQAAEQRVQDQLRIGTALITLREKLDAGSSNGEMQIALARMIDQLAPLEVQAGDGQTPFTPERELPVPIVAGSP